MLSSKYLSAAVGASLMLITLAVNAQESPGREAEQSGSMHQMPMETMHECMSHCQAMSGSMQELRSTVEEARESNDPEQMRAALNQVQKHMSGMEEMHGCMQMMQDGNDGRMNHDGA